MRQRIAILHFTWSHEVDGLSHESRLCQIYDQLFILVFLLEQNEDRKFIGQPAQSSIATNIHIIMLYRISTSTQ